MKMPKLPLRPLASALASAVLAAVLGACAAPASAPPTLYARLGGQARVEAVVSNVIDRAATDPRTRRSFDGFNLATLKKGIAQFICSSAGGGCIYEGDTMRVAHHDLRITASEFDALVSLWREEFDRAGVDAGVRNELLRLMAPNKRDVVTAASRGAGHV